MSVPENIHGTAVALEGRGVLLRGPSGAGKSLLALLLLERWQALGRAALLVADDRVLVAAAPDGIALAPPAAIAGLIELRGRGIVRRPYAEAARLALVVDLVEARERMPEPEAFGTVLLGRRVARCPVPRAGLIDSAHQVLLVVAAYEALEPAIPA